MNKTIIVNNALFTFVQERLHFKEAYGVYMKEIFEEYKIFCAERGVSPLSYRRFRESLEEVLTAKIPAADVTKKNNRYFIFNVIRGLEL